jgi:hypothetical protein
MSLPRNIPIKGGVVDLVYSPDDEAESGKGYYLHRYWLAEKRDGISKLFGTADEAMAALARGRLRWDCR